MSWRKTVVYLIILCALGSWLYFYEIKHKGQKKAEEEKASRLICIDNESVDDVKIRKDDGTVIHFKKIEGKWMLMEPVKTAADRSAVQGVVSTITSLKPERILKEKDVNWEEYGLQKPSFEATVGAKDVQNQIFLGDKNPSKSSYYMKKDDDPRLFLVADTVKNALNKSVFDLRDKDVLAISPADVDRVAIRTNDNEVEIKREAPEKWVLTKPASMKLKANLMNRDLNTLANLRAKDIIDSPNLSDEKFGLAAPKIAITLSGPKLEQVLYVGSPVKSEAAQHPFDSDVYASVKGKDAVYVVDLKSLKALVQSDLNVLRDKSLMSFTPNDVEKFEMELDGKKWVAVRTENNQWSLEEPKGITSLDSWNITSILWELRDLEWKSMSKSDAVPAEIAQPKLVASLALKGQKEPVVLKVGWTSQPSQSEAQLDTPTEDSARKPETTAAPTDSKTIPSSVTRDQGAKEASEEKMPDTVSAMVTPSDEQDTLYQVSGTFVTRVRKDLERMLEKK